MPLLDADYEPPFFLRNGHAQTLFHTLLRRVGGVTYRRERIDTPDRDFLDLDWSQRGHRRLAVVTHGLEGSTRSNYVRGMVRTLNRHGWDALAWNLRGCSGDMNRQLRFYHSGATEDLEAVVRYALTAHDYRKVALVGFSLGGNMVLKYLGEERAVSPRICGAAAVSVPCDLACAAEELARPTNRHYTRYFLWSLHQKIRAKMEAMPGRIDDEGYRHLKTMRDFDDRYTAPLSGFDDAEDYWKQSSCRPFLRQIRVPALLINAKDDPFLGATCYPLAEAEANPHFFLEVPEYGGHVGFVQFGCGGTYWSEERVVAFLERHAGRRDAAPGTRSATARAQKHC